MAQISTQTKNQKNAVSSKNNTALTTNKLSLGKDNKAVSAVIGVILMVAITVILAAIIGVFVMNMSGNLPKMPGYGAFTVERITYDLPSTPTPVEELDFIKLTNVGSNGEPITVISLKAEYNSQIEYLGLGDDAATPIELKEPTSLSALQNVAGTVFVPVPTDYAGGAFTLTVIGQTADGGQNILQTLNVPALAV